MSDPDALAKRVAELEGELALAEMSNTRLRGLNAELQRQNVLLQSEIEKHFLATQPAES